MSSTPNLDFPAVGNKPVTAEFNGGDLSSDAGVLLLNQAERATGVIAALARNLTDTRQPAKVKYTIGEMVSSRVFAIAMGYEDANDLDCLRYDPAIKMACDRLPATGDALPSQPSLSRLENAFGKRDLIRAAFAMGRAIVAQLPANTTHVILDVDATPDPCHGQQEFEVFNAHYDTHCYLPLLLHLTAQDGQQRLVAALLRPGNSGACRGLFALLRGAVGLLRERFPSIGITLRADSGFGNARVISFCEHHHLGFVLGLARNNRLQTLSTPVQMDAALKYGFEGDGCREFGEFRYKAQTWTNRYRVVTKAEITRGELNPRYIVTSDETLSPEDAYAYYCARGDQENRIKEFKLDLGGGRTSCHRFLANQFRVLLHVAACALMATLQRALHGTQWAKAQVQTIRVRLLKVAVRVVETTRRVWLKLPTSFPQSATWHLLSRRLSALSG
jgi:hypothetical protein